MVRRLLACAFGFSLVLAACSGDDRASSPSTPGEGEAVSTEPSAAVSGSEASEHAQLLSTLTALLPPDTTQVFAADLESLLQGDSGQLVAPLVIGEAGNPSLAAPLSVIGALGHSINVPAEIRTALVVYTAEGNGPALLARINSTTLDGAVEGVAPTFDRTYGQASHELYLDAEGNQLTLLPGGVLIIGTGPVVESIVDVADGATSGEASPLNPFVAQLSGDSDLGLAYVLPALFDPELATGSTLLAAEAVVGALDVVDGSMTGSLTFHMANGAAFVDDFNALNRASTAGGDEVPLTVADPHVDGLVQVVATVPPLPLTAGAAESANALAFFKKLFVGMEALEYANSVAERSEPAWLDFVVKSEADPSEPTSPGSVYIRWEFKDQEAIEAFERNELPEGFRIAPTRFIESDDPDGEYFFALNLYNAAGGSIVSGARAEWDVFVHPPEGADPNAGVRPRFMVVDVLAEDVSADAGNLLTPAEPLTHRLVDGTVTSVGARFDADGVQVPVFESSFPVPSPAEAEVARFTREMAIGNDYIYWDHGVSDRVLYNATTFNHDAYLVDVDQLSFTDDGRWTQYLDPQVKDAVYYVNNLEYVASPMANLDSDYLDITPEWLEALRSFTTNGHQDGLMRSAVEQLFLGEGDPFVGLEFANETPTTYFHFAVTDPVGLAASLNLEPEVQLAPIALFEQGEAAHYLTLSVVESGTYPSGARAQWSVYADDGSGRPPHMLIIETMTEHVAFDPATILNLPAVVQHRVDGDSLTTTLSSAGANFEASVDMASSTSEPLSLDWIEAGDRVCSRTAVCDLSYYDAETLDVSVRLAQDITITQFESPWAEFIEPTPSVVFFRDNSQEYAVKPWYNLDVAVDPLPFSGLDAPTHSIEGSGSLRGRVGDLVDSNYTYTGDAIVQDGQLSFAITQEIVNALGTANIFTTGRFDLAAASGTQTVVDCVGDALICSDIENGSSALYVVQNLDASDLDNVAWQIDIAVDLGTFGTADSSSTFEAVRIDS